MEELKTYLFSVIVSATICSLFQNILQNFKAKNIAKLICGIIMSISVLRPVLDWNDININHFFEYSNEEARKAVSVGSQYSYQTRADIIKLKTEAYILDKASELNADITVRVSVSEADEAIPVSVEIAGIVSPYNKKRLESILENSLGIAKENQQWIG